MRAPCSGGEECGERGWSRQTGDLPHLPPLLRHPPPGARPRHPHGAGTARPPRRDHDHDRHARSPVRRPRRPQSTRRDEVLALRSFPAVSGAVRAMRHATAMHLPALHVVPAFITALHIISAAQRGMFHRGEAKLRATTSACGPVEVQVGRMLLRHVRDLGFFGLRYPPVENSRCTPEHIGSNSRRNLGRFLRDTFYVFIELLHACTQSVVVR